MRKLALIAAAAAAVIAGSAGAAQASPAIYVANTPVFNAVYTPGGQPLLQQVQYFWGGRNYCWYDGGWNGPGYYWCGYGGRRGFGWGGGLGWHGWARGGGHYRGASYSAHRGHVGGGRGHGGGHSGGHGGGHGGGHAGGHGGGDHHH
jgi:hypothetical protein